MFRAYIEVSVSFSDVLPDQGRFPRDDNAGGRPPSASRAPWPRACVVHGETRSTGNTEVRLSEVKFPETMVESHRRKEIYMTCDRLLTGFTKLCTTPIGLQTS